MINDSSTDGVRGRGSRALVLGGGGPVGRAWELGMMDGFAGQGIDLGTADLIIGTSAGAVVGALLALKQGFGAPMKIDTAIASTPPPVRSDGMRFSRRHGAGGPVSCTGADTRRNWQDGARCANDQRGSIRFEIDVCSLPRAGSAEPIPSHHRKCTNRATPSMGCVLRCSVGTSDSGQHRCSVYLAPNHNKRRKIH